VKYLGREGLTFDLGVDARSGGLGQLREAVEMIEKVHEDGEATIVISSLLLGFYLELGRQLSDHMCKPNLRLSDVRSHPEFLEWKELVTKMASAPKAFMKLSGAFSELPPLEDEPDIAEIVNCLRPWTDVVFDAFGAERVMFGSDWPVCNVGGGGNDVAWSRWKSIVEEILKQKEFSEEQRAGVWGTVALRAYGIEI
jgi:L-rhamnono-1,4-lactonase